MPSCAAIDCFNCSVLKPILKFSSNPIKKLDKNDYVTSNVDIMKNTFQSIRRYTSAQSILKKIALKEIYKEVLSTFKMYL